MSSTRTAAALVLALLAACKDSARTATPAAGTTAAATPTTAAANAANAAGPDTSGARPIPAGPITATCEPLSAAMLDAVSVGIKGVGAQAPIAVLSHAFVIRDPKSPLYYISGTVTSAAGGAPYVMTWATQSLDVGRGLIFSVTPGARAVSIFPDSLPTVHPDNTSGAAIASRQCVMKATGVTKGL